MIDAFSLDRSLFKTTIGLILDEMHSRDWKVHVLKAGSNYLFIDRGFGPIVRTYGSTPPQQTYIDAMMSNNKIPTGLRLQEAGIKQLPTIAVNFDTMDGLENFLALHKKIVVKPIDGSHGDGIQAGITTIDEAKSAMLNANKFTSKKSALVQKHAEANVINDLRLLCINGKFVAAIHRLPARVIGNGTNSIQELISIENRRSRRGEPYITQYTKISLERAQRMLGQDGITRVPQKDDIVTVADIANYGVGGELIDVTDQIPEWLKYEAEQAAKHCNITVAGVDYLAANIPTPESSREHVNGVIIEINKQPSLYIHDHPHEGKNRHTVKALVDLISQY